MVELGDRSVISAVKQTHQSLAALVGHAHASLVMAQKCSQVPPATPLFTAIMNYRGQSIAAGPDEPSRAPRPFAHLDSGERNSYPLTLTVDEGDDDFRLSAQVEEAVEPDHICRMLVQSIDAIVTALETAPHSPVAGLEVLDHPQRDLLIKAWNATDQPSSRHGCVHRLFEEQALRTPERTAIVDGDHRLSYAQLNEKADRVAACLQDRGVAPGATICVCLPRSLDSVATLIALFKLGAAYMPLDAAQPYSRQKTMLEDARPSFVITTATGGLALPKIDGVPLIVIDDAYSALPHRDAPFKSADTAPNALAYVIYTSGSTGAPKGVMGAHGAVASRLLSERDRVRAGDVFAHKTNLGFIDSLWEIFLPLISGARLEVISAETVLEPELFVAALSRAGATHLVVVPALLGAVLDAAEAASGALDKLRYCACSGDALSAALAERWCLALPGAEITNIYGATEFWDATAHPYAGGGRDLLVPIGKPLPNVRVYVLDDEGRLAPIGVEGTLHVAGSGVALGYVGDEKRSGGGFMSPPAWLAEELIFKTGDRVRWRADGILEYRGRTDRQVKIRGFRIELDEVEIALTAHPDIHQAAVLATAETPGQTSAAAQDISADKRLVAYVVSETRGLDLQAVRQDLKLRFPDYMVPSVLVQLDALPLTSSGKVDRKALPEPEGGPEALAYMAPRTPVEAALVSIWADVLKLERVGVHDNFFELGGHSLLVMRILSKLKQQLGVTIPLRVLFAGPTPGQLAEHIQLTRLVSELGQTPEAMEDGDVGVL
jgi:amino acid adenylation domain-containing protein